MRKKFNESDVIVGAGAIIAKEGKVLLTKRAEKIIEGGKWCLPGGRVEKWEKAEDTLKREIKEELGVGVKNSKFLFYHDELKKKINVHAISLIFLVELNGKLKKNWEVSEIGWFDENEIKKLNLAYQHKEILRRFLRKNKNDIKIH